MTTDVKPVDVLVQFQERYGPPAGESGPIKMVREVFGETPDDWQEKVLEDYGGGERSISVRSSHGPGKTCVAAWTIVHQILTRFPQKTACTAPTGGQLFDALLAEVKTWIRRLPGSLQQLLEIKSDRIELRMAPEESFATFRTARSEQPEALQGVHAPWVLLVIDEGSGVPEVIIEAASGSMSGKHATTLILGNPIRTSGFFFDTHHKLKDLWRTYQVCAGEAVPEQERRNGVHYSTRVSREFVEDMARRYGIESNPYRVRVLGEFPRSDLDTIIPFELVEAARKRDVEPSPTAPRLWGLDVARFGDDQTALCKRKQNIIVEPIRTWRDLDTMQVTGVVKAEWDATPPSERPLEILVDVIGLGAGVCDRLRELQLPARGINVSESPAVTGDRFLNLRTELWFQAKEWFTRRDCSIPEDENFQQEIVQSKYEIQASSGKIKVESKDKAKKRGMRSPDRADAFILTFASMAATALHGGSGGWGKPIKRNVKGVV